MDYRKHWRRLRPRDFISYYYAIFFPSVIGVYLWLEWYRAASFMTLAFGALVAFGYWRGVVRDDALAERERQAQIERTLSARFEFNVADDPELIQSDDGTWRIYYTGIDRTLHTVAAMTEAMAQAVRTFNQAGANIAEAFVEHVEEAIVRANMTPIFPVRAPETQLAGRVFQIEPTAPPGNPNWREALEAGGVLWSPGEIRWHRVEPTFTPVEATSEARIRLGLDEVGEAQGPAIAIHLEYDNGFFGRPTHVQIDGGERQTLRQFRRRVTSDTVRWRVGQTIGHQSQLADPFYDGFRAVGYSTADARRLARVEERAQMERERTGARQDPIRQLPTPEFRIDHTDETGTLWRKEWPAEARIAPEAWIEVTNSTPEPDGTFARYMIRVRPDVKTAREAVASTFGLTAEQYNPEKET